MGPRLKDVEDKSAQPRHQRTETASMGPRLKDVEDDVYKRSSVAEASRASMGPRLKDVEDPIRRSRRWTNRISFNGATSQGRGRRRHNESIARSKHQLQWGHVSRTWKTEFPFTIRPPLSPLQWGHVSRTWKTPSGPGLVDTSNGFNGATSQGRGRLGVQWWCADGNEFASMGPRLKDVEDSLHQINEVYEGYGFNGATSQGRGRPDGGGCPCRAGQSFNGATSQGRGRPCHPSQIQRRTHRFNGATSQGRGRHASAFTCATGTI